MKDDIDDKLSEAINQMWGAAIDYALSEDLQELSTDERDALYIRYQANMGKKVIAQIKQVFQDAGYIRLISNQEQQAAIANMMLGNKVMTGQEFYDKFWREYELPEGRNPKFIDSTTVRKDIDIIARRAAGLADE